MWVLAERHAATLSSGVSTVYTSGIGNAKGYAMHREESGLGSQEQGMHAPKPVRHPKGKI